MTSLTLVPPVDQAQAAKQLPCNIEAEQALLGALLYDNGAYDRCDTLRPEHFYEPFHARMFAAIESAVRKGQLAEPILIADKFANDPAFEELGGLRYLADLVDRAPSSAHARDFARVVSETAKRRELIRISGEIAQRAETPEDDDTAASLIEDAEAELYRLAESGQAAGGVVSFADAITGAVQMAAAAYERDGGLSGTSTGLIDLDRKLGGLHPSDLVILAARPSAGKTALACNIAFHAARNYAYEQMPDGTRRTTAGGQVLFFSLEMSAEQLANRILAEVSGISGDRIRKGEIEAHEFGRYRDAAIEIQEAPLYIDDTGGLQMAKLAARARRQKRMRGLDLIVVDYLQLVTMGGKSENRVQEVSAITMGLKALAKELDVPVLALSQLSRQVEQREDKRPQLSDLRESGSIEQDADMVLFLYREEYYLERSRPEPNTAGYEAWITKMDACRGRADVIIGKQRHGPIGTVTLAFNGEITKFSNLAQDDRYPAARSPYGDA